MSPTGSRAIEVVELTRRHGSVVAVDAVSFSVERGEMFGLIGPDGAGKTTTLRVVLGLARPDGGRARTCGLDPFRHRRDLSGRVGYLSQRFSMYGDLSVDENVAFFAEAHGVSGFKVRRDQILDQLRLAPFRSRLADRLSGGMKQKLALACTLIHEPEVLVLDEPTTGVDPVSRREFWRILSRLQADGMTIVLTTPYLDEAERCGRVGLMHRGRLLEVDAPDRLRASVRGTVLELIASPRRKAAAILAARVAAPRVTDVQAFGERLHVALEDVPSSQADEAGETLAGDLRAEGIALTSIRRVAPSLEDVFIARIRSAETGPGPHEEDSP